MTSVPPPKKEGSVVRSVSVSSLPSFDKQAAPVEVPTTVVAAFRMPAQGLHVPATGEINSLPTKVSPPPPKPPLTATQNPAAQVAHPIPSAPRPPPQHW